MTTLLDPTAYPAAELEADTRRWRLEMSLDDLKTTLGMESLHCKTPAMVQKELLVYDLRIAAVAASPLKRLGKCDRQLGRHLGMRGVDLLWREARERRLLPTNRSNDA